MDAHLIDSAIFGHGWSTPESREVFSEAGRTARWLTVLKALASAQADMGIIPASSAQAIESLDATKLDFGRIAEGTRRTSHSTLGLISELQRHLPEAAREHVYYGVTVQDITDTSAALEIQEITGAAWRDLWAIEGALVDLAEAHVHTPMLGRTHGQPGAPITFGFKAACWADEVARHLQRLTQAAPRLLVAQLAGAVGVLGFFGNDGLELRRRFSARLGLGEPTASWTSARDRLAELGWLAATITATLARVCNEVYNLQRGEIAELAEGSSAHTVGSITMPHKNNPESSEQTVVLARLVRSAAGVLTETMVADHERDARSWKAEWVLLPEIGHYTMTQTAMARTLVTGLEVNVAAMGANLARHGHFESQELLRRLSARIGKHNAQARLQELYSQARRNAVEVADIVRGLPPDDPVAAAARHGGDVFGQSSAPALGQAAEMATAVVTAARTRRQGESQHWPALPLKR